jgi:hypothetical protein
MRKLVLGLLGAAAFGSGGLLVAASASAGTLDQSQTTVTTPVGYEPVGAGFEAAQTFTAGLSGGLDRVDVSIDAEAGCTADLIVAIRAVDSGGSLTGTIRALAAISPTSVPTRVNGSQPAGLTQATFPYAAQVTAGDRYGIVLLTDSNNCYGWYLANTNPYPGGTAFATTSPNGPLSPIGAGIYDYAFRTYVLQPSAPPNTVPPTGRRAAALKKCKKRASANGWSRERLRKCKRKARRLPV